MPTMRAGIATADGVAFHSDIPRPAPAAGQVLVRVSDAGLNHADLNSARLTANTPFTIVGQEWAGEIVEVGSGVTNVKAGDHVMCFGRNGGYAEYAVTEAGWVMRFNPRELKTEQAAVLPLALLTAHDALVTRGQLQSGQSVLVQGASSAVGMMTLQVARLKGASLVVGTSRDAEKYPKLQAMGATLMLNSSTPDWADKLLEATSNKGVDVVVDFVSGPTVNGSIKAMAVLGRMVNVGRLGGATAEFNFDQHAAKRINYIGVTFRTRTTEEISDIVTKVQADLAPAIRDGRLALPIDRTFKLEDAAAAHALMSSNGQFGKIVLSI